jgi:peptide chain release factor 1
MLEKLIGIEERYNEINHLLEETGEDYQRATELAKERAEIEPIVLKTREYRQAIKQREEAEILLQEEDDELRALAETDLENLIPIIQGLEKELKSLLLPKDPR